MYLEMSLIQRSGPSGKIKYSSRFLFQEIQNYAGLPILMNEATVCILRYQQISLQYQPSFSNELKIVELKSEL